MYRIKDTWCQSIPALHRTLADPDMQEHLLHAAKDLDFEKSCAHWEALHYLFTALLGWESPGHGLAWWYNAGKPVEEPLLKMVRQIWDPNFQLHYYAAWAWTPEQSFISEDDLNPAELACTSLYSNETWWRLFKESGRRFRHDPFYGGSNPLHLGHSDEFGMDYVSDGDPQPIMHSNTKDRRAVLIVSSLGHWRRNLINMGSQLLKLNDHSWHVEVFDRQYGFLGLLRQSRVTGKWFMGKHSVHMAGNPVD